MNHVSPPFPEFLRWASEFAISGERDIQKKGGVETKTVEGARQARGMPGLSRLVRAQCETLCLELDIVSPKSLPKTTVGEMKMLLRERDAAERIIRANALKETIVEERSRSARIPMGPPMGKDRRPETEKIDAAMATIMGVSPGILEDYAKAAVTYDLLTKGAPERDTLLKVALLEAMWHVRRNYADTPEREEPPEPKTPAKKTSGPASSRQ